MSGLNQISPFVNKAFIDLISTGYAQLFFFKQVTFWNLIILTVIVKIANTIINRLSWYGSNVLKAKINHHLRGIAFRHLLKLSVGFYNKNQSGQIMSKLTRGAGNISDIVTSVGMQFLPTLTSGVFAIIVVTSINPLIGISSAAIFIPFFYLRFNRFKKLETVEKKSEKTWDLEYGHFWEVISNIRLVKIFNAENFELNKFYKTARKIVNLRVIQEKIYNKGTIADLLIDVYTVAIYGYIFHLGFTGQFTLGTVILMIQYVEMVKQPLWSLNWVFWEVKFALIGVKEYLKAIDSKIDITEVDHPITLLDPKGKVEFRHIDFRYPEKKKIPVFKDLSFVIESGQTWGVVGKSGVGKTSMAHLLARFFDPDQGQILIDDIDLRDISFASLHHQVGLVMQDSYLYDETIVSNLRYGKPNATEEEIVKACEAANAMEFIEKLPKKLNTKIGERGVKLSGGQKQRLSIARTILQNPKIIIFDEATSALDSHSEKLIQDALWKLTENRTTIIIAHRLSTIRKADNIIVIDNKKIKEQGTHEQLLKRKGVYSELWALQSHEHNTTV